MAVAKAYSECGIWYGEWVPGEWITGATTIRTGTGAVKKMLNIQAIPERPALYRATVVDSRDHELLSVGPFVANSDSQARLMAWAMAAEDNAGLTAGVVEYYDIVLEFLGVVRPKRDED